MLGLIGASANPSRDSNGASTQATIAGNRRGFDGELGEACFSLVTRHLRFGFANRPEPVEGSLVTAPEASMPLKPGTMLGPYEILNLIGAGKIRAATVMERPPKPRLLAIAEDSTTNWGKPAFHSSLRRRRLCP